MVSDGKGMEFIVTWQLVSEAVHKYYIRDTKSEI